jgi:hypothetical protein
VFSFPDTPYATDPFPHAVIEGAWDDELLKECKRDIASFTDWTGERNFPGARHKRYWSDPLSLPASVLAVIHAASSPPFLEWLAGLTGIDRLIPDPYLNGGGIHSIGRGGFLGIHTDFNYHQRLDCYRRLNLLLYLNDWNENWGGALELWKDKRCAKVIHPHRNTMVIFTTDDDSFHGHPHPMLCPEGEFRDSIALYYYTANKPEAGFASVRTSTNYR